METLIKIKDYQILNENEINFAIGINSLRICSLYSHFVPASD